MHEVNQNNEASSVFSNATKTLKCRILVTNEYHPPQENNCLFEYLFFRIILKSLSFNWPFLEIILQSEAVIEQATMSHVMSLGEFPIRAATPSPVTDPTCRTTCTSPP